MASIDYTSAAKLLATLFAKAEHLYQEKQSQTQLQTVSAPVRQACDALFASSTQSYREVLLGCCLARIFDASINIRHPYVNQSEDAFNGRTLDEKVVNPFLQDRLIPCSKGPYLASFRRNVKFVSETGKGLRDKEGYKSLLVFLDMLEHANKADAKTLTLYLLARFVELRNASRVPLSQISRLSLEQYNELLTEILQVQSGGLVPVLLVVAMLKTIKACFNLEWEVKFQGINVSDKSSGAGGDITVTLAGIRFEPLRLADLDPPEIGMQRIEEIIDFGGNDHAWDGKHRAATFSSPFRSNGPELLAGRDIPPVRGKILDLYPVYCYGLRKPDFDHDIASPKRFILNQHFEHGQGLARRGINERNAFTIPAAAVESGSVSGKRRFSESRGG